MQIRHAEPDADAAACLAVYAPFADDTAVSFEDPAPTLAEYRARIAQIAATHAYLVAEHDGRIAGFAYGGPHRVRPAYRWSTEVSVYIGDGHRGKGLGRSLYGALLPLLEQQGYRVALAGITLPNDPSLGLHRTLGFEEVGVYRRIGWKAGGWQDVIWLQRLLGPTTHERVVPPDPGAPVVLPAPVQL